MSKMAEKQQRQGKTKTGKEDKKKTFPGGLITDSDLFQTLLDGNDYS